MNTAWRSRRLFATARSRIEVRVEAAQKQAANASSSPYAWIIGKRTLHRR